LEFGGLFLQRQSEDDLGEKKNFFPNQPGLIPIVVFWVIWRRNWGRIARIWVEMEECG
jgi:hypothetical protein